MRTDWEAVIVVVCVAVVAVSGIIGASIADYNTSRFDSLETRVKRIEHVLMKLTKESTNEDS